MVTLSTPLKGTYIWGGFRVWQRNWDAFLRSWKVEIGGIFVEPVIVLLAFGFGLGAFVREINGLTYAQFVAPALVATYAMWHATFDSTYGAYLRMETNHIYDAFLFTPIGPEDIVAGEVMWSATRALLSGTAVLLAAAAFGLVSSPLALLAIPLAYLVGLMFASISMVMTASATTIGSMNNFFTLFLLPMFWVGGVFFPLERLPEGLQLVAWITPLPPAAALSRALVTGETSWAMLVWLLQMAAYTLAAFLIAARLLRRRLIK